MARDRDRCSTVILQVHQVESRESNKTLTLLRSFLISPRPTLKIIEHIHTYSMSKSIIKQP